MIGLGCDSNLVFVGKGVELNTPAHIFLAATVLAKPKERTRNVAALIGGLLPDLSLYLMVFYQSQINGRSFEQIFNEDYFHPYWQSIFSIDNSIPLFLGLFMIGWWRKWVWLWVLSAASIMHLFLDFPLHHDDGRAHFWPFSDWIFQSPISYWDINHHGAFVSTVEILFVFILACILWRRFKTISVRAVIIIGFLIQASTGAAWNIIFG